MTIAVTATIAEFAVRGIGVSFVSKLIFGIGAFIALAGVGLRDWAARTRCPFSAGATPPSGASSPNHAGPYAWIRHPGPMGTLMTLAGLVLAMASVSGAIAIAVLVVPAYRWRVRMEECALISTAGPPYLAYREHVPAFLPRPFGRTLHPRSPP